jgi:hypothetical protein
VFFVKGEEQALEIVKKMRKVAGVRILQEYYDLVDKK